MASSEETQVIELANDLNDFAAQFLAVIEAATELNARWNALNAQAVMNAMGTVATNADGTLGTADATPVTGHTINPATYPGFSRQTSAYNWGALLTLVQQFLNLNNGQAVTTQANAPTLLAEMTGG